MLAYDHLVEVRNGMGRIARSLKSTTGDAPERVKALLERVDGLEAELDDLRSARRGDIAAELAGEASRSGDVRYLVAPADGLNGNELRHLALGIRDRLGEPSVVVVGSVFSGKGALVGLVSKDLVTAGLSAAELIRPGASALGGGGSPDPELAQAGGPNGERLGTALAEIVEKVEEALNRL
jgi:alanyl-tRNA synthetase